MGVRSKNMNSIGPIKSSFLSCEKDLETIVRKLFIESKPYNETLKRLLIFAEALKKSVVDCSAGHSDRTLDDF